MSNNTTNKNELIQEQVREFIIDPLASESVVLSNSPRIIDSAAPVKIPRITNTSGVGFVGEGQEIPDDYTVETAEFRLMPENMKSLKTISRVTNELVRSAAVGVSQMLQQRIVTDMRSTLDDALLVGDGASDGTGVTPTGILNQADIQTGVLDLSDPDTLLDGVGLAAVAEVTPNRWFINPADFITLRKVKDGNGQYVIQPDITQGARYALHGIPVVVSNKVPKGKVALVDMNQVVVVRDTDPQVKILEETYASTDEIGIRVTSRYDIGLINPKAVVVLSTAEVEG